MGSLDAFAQAAFVYQSESRAARSTFDEGILGKNRAYGLADFSVGFGKDSWTAQIFLNNAFDGVPNMRFARRGRCGARYRRNQPRTVGVKFRQKF